VSVTHKGRDNKKNAKGWWAKKSWVGELKQGGGGDNAEKARENLMSEHAKKTFPPRKRGVKGQKRNYSEKSEVPGSRTANNN